MTGQKDAYRTEYGCLLTNGQVFRHPDLEAAEQHVKRACEHGYGDLTIVSRRVPMIVPGPWETHQSAPSEASS